MTVIQDLGRVKGEDGDVFLPTIQEINGEFVFSWERVPYDEAETAILNDYPLRLPMYVPEMDGTTLKFRLTKPTKNIDGTFLQTVIDCGNVKGDQGPEGNIRYRIQQIPPDIEITDPSIERRVDTLYVQGKKAWIYDENASNSEDPFILIEGMDLSGYALKADVYDKDTIDDMFNGVTREVEKIMELYDINMD